MDTQPKRLALLLAAITALIPLHAAAQQPPISLNPQAVLKQWGEVLYCQEAYRHPDNAPRVYDYDLRQCAAAEQAVLRRLGGHTPEVRAELRKVAQREAARIRANTRDISQVLSACRQTCTSLADGDAASGAGTGDGETPGKPGS